MTKKEQALKLMKDLNIYRPYIKEYAEKDRVCFFEGFGGYWVDQENELYAKMKEIEKKHKCKVYAITHEGSTDELELVEQVEHYLNEGTVRNLEALLEWLEHGEG